MSLCIRCGKVYEHAKGCVSAPEGAFDASPQARNERTLGALKEAQSAIEAAKPLVESKPRDAAKALFAVESTLTRHPSGDLASFEHKRNYKATEESLSKLKTEVLSQLGDRGSEIFTDLAYSKRALELLHAVHLRRREIGSITLDELAQVPGLGFNPKEATDPTDPGSLVKNACETIEKQLASTAGIDFDVDQWGKQFVESLSLGEPPRAWPARFLPSVVMPCAFVVAGVATGGAGVLFSQIRDDRTILLGGAGVGVALVVTGIVLLARSVAVRGKLPSQFEALSQNYRLRLYLVAVDRCLRRYVSTLSQAEEAFRAHTSGDQAARWKRIKTQERDLVKAVAGDGWDERHPVDEEIVRKISAANLVSPDSLKSANALPREMWDGLGKAYFLNRREEDSGNEAWLATMATGVLERLGTREDTAGVRKLALTNARSAFAGRTTQRLVSTREL
jgi:hypothetical protein